jgi:hypothetical protein
MASAIFVVKAKVNVVVVTLKGRMDGAQGVGAGWMKFHIRRHQERASHHRKKLLLLADPVLKILLALDALLDESDHAQ